MAIRFACEQCGHPFEVDDRHAGQLGRCKHCGHIAPIPGSKVESPAPAIGLKLRPIDDEGAGHHREAVPAPGLQIRPVPPEDIPATRGLDPDEDEHDHEPQPQPSRRRSKRKQEVPLYPVLDPDQSEARQARPFHLNPHYETRLARFAARYLRWARDSLFVISVAFLALGTIGYAFEIKALLHVAAAGLVGANIGMLVVSLFYLVTLPFKDSLAKGLATLLLPPYAVYYWVTHWPRMRRPVINTARSFAPIVLVGLGYLFYLKAPVIEREAGKVEQVFEKGGEAIEKIADPGETMPADEPVAAPEIPDVPSPKRRSKVRSTLY